MSNSVINGKYWIPCPSNLIESGLSFSFPYSVNAYLPVTLLRSEGSSGYYSVDFGNEGIGELKSSLKEAHVRAEEDVMSSASPSPSETQHVVDLKEANKASCLHAMGMKYKFGKQYYVPMSSVGIWMNPMQSGIENTGQYCNDITSMSNTIEQSMKGLLANTSSSAAINMVYPTVEFTRKALSETGSSQYLLLRGCSGSGKSEAFKHAIQYLLFTDSYIENGYSKNMTSCANMQKTAQEHVSTSKYNPLATAKNPFLYDKFGNNENLYKKAHACLTFFHYFNSCSTSYNDNSSRSMKSMRLIYDKSSQRVTSFRMKSILHDTAHRMSPLNGDKKKCYHIFTMLLHAVEASLLASYGVSDKVKDMYLGGGRRSSVVTSVPFSYTANSPEELCTDFHYLKETLLFAGVTESDWNEVVESLIVIVLLQGVAVVGTDTAIIANASQTLIHAAEKILGVRNDSLLNMFLRYTSGRLGTLDHTPASAKGAINAVCVNIYRRIFSHMGKKLCGSSFIPSAENSGEDSKDNDLYLELIDTLGYEQRWLMGSYPAGNLYTLAKNYCGEAFVQHYSTTIFDNVVQSYAEDNVFLSGFTAPSTQNYIELLELPKKGLIGIIEEVSNSMRPDEKAILDKSFQEFAKNKMVKAAGSKSKKTEFIVRHYFGEALYDVEGFVMMNKSPLASKTEANEVLDDSKLSIISSEKEEDDGKEDESAEGQKKPGKLSNRFGQSKHYMLNQFKSSLSQTFKDMSSEGNGFHYLLCIKPSEDLEGSTFDARFVEPQLDNGMLPEILQLNKVGYPCRISMGTFYEKYKTILHIFHSDDSLEKDKQLSPEISAKREHNEKLLTSILATLELSPEDLSLYQEGGANAPEYGKENIYLRLPLQNMLDTSLSFKMLMYNSMVIRIQSLVRKRQASKTFYSLKRISTLMAALARRKAAKKRFLRTRYLVDKLTANVKRNLCRRKFVAMKGAVNVIKRKLIGSGFYKDRLRYLIVKKNIRSIHMLVRSHLLRRQTDRIVTKVHILQNAGRYYLFKKKWLNKKNHNATVIQRHFRGYYERHYRSKDAVIYIYNKRRLRIATKVTRQIQRHFRVRMIRRRFQQLRAATRVLQHWLRGRRGRIRFLKIVKVTAWLQKHTRRILAADRFSYLLANAMMIEEKKRMKILRDEEISRAYRCNLYTNDMEDMATATASMAAMSSVPTESSYTPVAYLTSPTTPTREEEKELPLLVMGSQLLKDGRTVAYESLAGFDLYSDISGTYPKGLLLTLLTLHAEFNARNVFVSKIRLGSNHCLVVDDHNHIYGFGLGDHGEFGNGTKKSHTSPKLLDTLIKCIARDEMALMNVHNGLDTTINLKNVVVKELFCGREHSMLLSDTGFVWTWGKNNRGQLGHNNFQTSYYPRLVHVQTIIKTNTDNHQIWKLGKDVETTKMSPLRNIKSIGCGAYFCGVINDQGLVYTWGAYECLGREPLQKEYETLSDLNRRVRPDSSLPCLVEHFLPQQGRGRLVADQLCCGDSHVTVVVSATSRSIKSGIELYSWGNNSCGQLGINDRKVLQSFTPRIVNMKPIQISRVEVKSTHNSPPTASAKKDRSGRASTLSKINLVSGGRHMVLNLDGELWTWGWNKFGQCGVGESFAVGQSCVHEPTKLHIALKLDGVVNKHSGGDTDGNKKRKSLAQQQVDASFDFGVSPIVPPQRGSTEGKTPDITDLSTTMAPTMAPTQKEALKEYTLNNPDIPEVIKSVHAGWKYSLCVTNKGKVFFWGSMALIPGVATMSLESQTSQSSLGDIKAALYGTPGGAKIGSDPRDVGSGTDMSRGHGRSSLEQRTLDSLAQEADGLPILSTPVQLITDPDTVGFVEGVSGCSNSNASVLTICGIDPIARMEAMKFGNITRTKELAAMQKGQQAQSEEKEVATTTQNTFDQTSTGCSSPSLLKHPLRNKSAKKKVTIKNTTANLLPRETKSSTLHSGFASVQRAEEMLAKAQEKAHNKVLHASSNNKLRKSRASYIGKQPTGPDTVCSETDSNTSSMNSKKAHRFSILQKERAGGESKRRTSSKSPPPPPSGTNPHTAATNGQVIGKRSSIASANTRSSIRASIGKDKTHTDLSINRADAIDLSRGVSHEERNERAPLMPHYHSSVRNPLEKGEISYRASAEEINRAFKNANLSSRINPAEFLNAKKKDEEAEEAKILAERKEKARAKREKRNSLRGAEESKSPIRSRTRDGDTLSQTSGTGSGRQRRTKSPATSIISSVVYDKAAIARKKVSSEAITDLLTMTPKVPDTDPFMDPSKPSYKAFARARRSKARGVGMPQEDKKILMSLDFTNATSKEEEEDPFGLLAEFREKPKDQTVDSEFLSFVDSVLTQEESDTTRKQRGGILAQESQNKKTTKVMDPQAERNAISTQRKQAYVSATGADNAESISKALFGGVPDSSTTSGGNDVNVDDYFADLQAEINDLSNTDKESAAVSRMAKYKADSKSSRGKRATVAQLSRMAAFGSATYTSDPLAKMQVSEVKALSSTIASLRLESKSQKPF